MARIIIIPDDVPYDDLEQVYYRIQLATRNKVMIDHYNHIKDKVGLMASRRIISETYGLVIRRVIAVCG